MPAEASHTQHSAKLLSLPKPGRERELVEIMPSDAKVLHEAHSSIERLYFSSWPQANTHTAILCVVSTFLTCINLRSNILELQKKKIFLSLLSHLQQASPWRWGGLGFISNKTSYAKSSFLHLPPNSQSISNQTALKSVIRLVPALCFEWDMHWAGH